jgi:uncharacterized repeat protein (TIGR03803 family)
MKEIQPRRKSPSVGTALVLAAVALAVAGLAVPAQAQYQYSVFHDFTGGMNEPSEPAGPLAQGLDGNLYGASHSGGSMACTGGCGTIYQIGTSQGSTPRVLYPFPTYDDCGMGLTLGTDGKFYGVCRHGGINKNGYVFQVTLSPFNFNPHFYDFCAQPNCADGANPSGRPIEGADGNFYGTTFHGGKGSCNDGIANGCGTVYQITPAGNLTTIYPFLLDANLSYPNGALSLGYDGYLYGTTEGVDTGSTCSPNCGAVYKITAAGVPTLLHTFAGGASDGATPKNGVIQSSDPNFFYGTTAQGGKQNVGTVFRITNKPGKPQLLHSFASGYGVPRGLEEAPDLNFYGEANTCKPCKDSGDGSLFEIEITPKVKFSIVHKFGGQLKDDGYGPDSVLSNTNGNLYGVTYQGGMYNDGVVYWLQPSFFAGYCRPQIAIGQVKSSTTILGQGFDGSSVVEFYPSVQATTLAWGPFYITVEVPAGAQTGPVTVTTPGSPPLTSLGNFYVTH